MKFESILTFAAVGSTLATTTQVADAPTEPRKLIIGSDGVGNERGTVSLQTLNGSHFCGGVLIADDMVLTAAHCLINIEPTEFQVEVGTNQIGSGTAIRSADYEIHRRYNRNTLANDIAVVLLSRGAGIGFKQYDRGFQSTTNGEATVYGWGRNDANERVRIQQRVTVPLLPDAACINEGTGTLRYSKAGNMCAGVPRGTPNHIGFCKGDSGGALYKGSPSSRTVIGIVSYNAGDCRDLGKYTTVSAYRNWIGDAMDTLRSFNRVRSVQEPCPCANTDDTDVGNYCSNWLNAPLDWCYAPSGSCGTAVESSRYPGRYWTKCVRSVLDEVRVEERGVPSADSGLGVEDFSKAIDIPLPEDDDEGTPSAAKNYAVVGGIVGAVGFAAVGTAVVALRRRRAATARTNHDNFAGFATSNPGFANGIQL